MASSEAKKMVLQVELFVSIYKEYLNRSDWEEGVELMGL
jgi:hypothetical protein